MNDQRLFVQANQAFGRLVRQIQPDRWADPSPQTPDWTIRQLVAHLTDDNRWVSDMLAGKTVDQVAGQYGSDVLGDDAQAAWSEAAESAEAAVNAHFDTESIVHLSYGDVTAAEYLSDLIIDRTVHAWDLAQALKVDPSLPDRLVESAYDKLVPQAEAWRQSGMFGPKADPASSDTLAKLVALTGRLGR